MAFARLKKKRVWHWVISGSRSVCNVELPNEASIYTKELRPNEDVCANCQSLIRAYKPRAKSDEYKRQYLKSREAESKGEYENLIHTDEIVQWIGQERPVSELTAMHDQRAKVQAILAERTTCLSCKSVNVGVQRFSGTPEAYTIHFKCSDCGYKWSQKRTDGRE